MTAIQKMDTLLNKCNIEQLKEIAISFNDKFSDEEMIIADRIYDMLIKKMQPGEFVLFADKSL